MLRHLERYSLLRPLRLPGFIKLLVHRGDDFICRRITRELIGFGKKVAFEGVRLNAQLAKHSLVLKGLIKE